MSKQVLAIMGCFLFLFLFLVPSAGLSAYGDSDGDRFNPESNETTLEEAEYQLPKRLPTHVQPEGMRLQSDPIDNSVDNESGTQVPMVPQPPSDQRSELE